jgi:hypothetical protein
MEKSKLPPATHKHGEYRRWHPVHCFLYYTDDGELKAPFTYWSGGVMRWEEKWAMEERVSAHPHLSNSKTSSEL